MNKVYSRNYRFRTLVKFAVLSIFMQIFLSLYTIVDGMFVSRFVGTVALSAINIVYPVVSLALALAIMLATGGSAIVGIQLGEKQERQLLLVWDTVFQRLQDYFIFLERKTGSFIL